MTEKIYEYKDDNNWFVGKWGGHNIIQSLNPEETGYYHELAYSLRCLHKPYQNLEGQAPKPNSYNITVIKSDNELLLIRFVLEMIKAETGRELMVHQQAGAFVITEENRLLMVKLPEGGVAVADFFGTEDQATGFGDTVLIATRNEGKTKEFKKLFEQFGLRVENLNDYPDLPEVPETGLTFEENARLKAETIAELTGKMVLADDSGLKVDILGGLPGVWSARFAGSEASDEANTFKLLHELSSVHQKKRRSAQFHCTLVVAAPDKESLVVEAEWPGYIAFEPKGDNGFGYDPIFLIGESDQTSAQLSPEEKNAQSHRGLAVKKLMEVFPTWQASN